MGIFADVLDREAMVGWVKVELTPEPLEWILSVGKRSPGQVLSVPTSEEILPFYKVFIPNTLRASL